MSSLSWVITLENKFQKSFILFFSCMAIVLISFIDLVTDQKISLYVLYSIPIFTGFWLISPVAGFFLCIAAVFGWMIVDLQLRTRPWAFVIWNAGLRLCFFFGISYVLSSLKLTLEREERWAQIDFLTELPNRRSFLAIANQERERAIRHKTPLTLAYIDLDNFKQINDFPVTISVMFSSRK